LSSPKFVNVRKKVWGITSASASTTACDVPSPSVRITEAFSEKVTIATRTSELDTDSAEVNDLMKSLEACQPSAGTDPEASIKNARSST